MHLSFRRNLGNADRMIRLVIGVVLLYLVFFNPLAMSSWVSILLGLVGVAMIVEGLLAY